MEWPGEVALWKEPGQAQHRDLIRLARDSYVDGVILLNADCHYDLLQVVMH